MIDILVHYDDHKLINPTCDTTSFMTNPIGDSIARLAYMQYYIRKAQLYNSANVPTI